MSRVFARQSWHKGSDLLVPAGYASPVPTSIDHVQIVAPKGSEQAARAFFGELVGLTEIAKPKLLANRGGVWFAIGATQQLHIGSVDDFFPAKRAHLALLCESDVELDEIVARIGDVTWDNSWPDSRRCYVEDPWGNRLELMARS